MYLSTLTYFFKYSLIISLLVTLFTSASAQRKTAKILANKELSAVIHKDTYHITILLPLDSANTHNNNNIISFYNGIKLALSDIDKDDNKIIVRALALSQQQVENFEAFAFGRDLKNTDLIIAPVTGKAVDKISEFALKHQINFISALSPSTSQLDYNNYLHIIYPTLESNIEKIVDFSKAKYPKHRKILLYKNSKDNEKATQFLKEELKGDKSIIHYDISYAPFSSQALAKQLSPNDLNIIYLAELNPKAINEYLNVIMNVPENYEIAIMGLPTLYRSAKIKNKNNPNIQYYYSTPFYYDNNTGFVKKINALSMQHFATPANELTYRGYEIMYWYSNILRKYGKNFIYDKHFKIDSPYTPFDMQTIIDNNKKIEYHENKFLYIYKINNGLQEVIEE